jgi:hypothetical protein
LNSNAGVKKNELDEFLLKDLTPKAFS